MGIVWRAEDRTIGRRVAIKELHVPTGVPSDGRAAFEVRVLREARAAGRLNDPGVVTVHDVLQEDGAAYIVMELVEAPTLSALVTRENPLPQDAVARLAEQLLSALGAAHAAGVVHRDVKPSNVMVLPSGRVKLADFGIAQSAEDTRLTTSGAVVGSPAYIAPERLHGQAADARSDLWALGAVLFYAVEGYSPFERASAAATMYAIVNESPELTRCKDPLASVIAGLLNASPDARPTANEVRGQLAQVTHAPATSSQTGVGARSDVTASKIVRRIAVAIVLAAAIVAGASILPWNANVVPGAARPLSGDDLKRAILAQCPYANPDTLQLGPIVRASGYYWAFATNVTGDVVECQMGAGSGMVPWDVAQMGKNEKVKMLGAGGNGKEQVAFGRVAPEVARLEVMQPDGDAIDAEVVGGLYAFVSNPPLKKFPARAYDNDNTLIYNGLIPVPS
jgi:hypothetical protein